MRRAVRNRSLFLLFVAVAATVAQSTGLASTSGVYNTSETPLNLPWNTYNFCNAPHVNAAHYELPEQASTDGAQLLHVSIVMRHHKVRRPHVRESCIIEAGHILQRTPDNLAPLEGTLGPPVGTAWDCTGAVQLTYDQGGTAIAHDAVTPAQQPFARTIWRGTCDAGQLTAGGLRDAARHGKVRPLI